MIVTFDPNRPVRFYWRYEKVKEKKREVIYTHCLMVNHTDGTVISTGYTKLHKEDAFVKKEGRKHSLTNLLKTHYSDPQHRSFRTNVWEAYARMVNNKF